MERDIVITLVSTVLSLVLGSTLTHFYYRRSLRDKQPCWSVRSNNLIKHYASRYESEIPDLEISYRGTPIENLTISKVAFWNNGRGTIDKNDMVAANPVRIVAKEGVKLLDVRLLSSSRSSQFSYKLDEGKQSAFIVFDYIDKGQGAVFQVFHTGISSMDITLEGDLKGASDLARKRLDVTDSCTRIIFAVVCLLIGSTFLVPLMLDILGIRKWPALDRPSAYIAYALLAGVLIPLGLSLLRPVMPRELRVYEEGFYD